ncbi:MAG: SAM-dependent chlorinase/fluorinase [candidate division NC10 bacterium]|nr:SAM-dependent chlorinase/fluorinase [candidate division NC10 bacterium]
MREIRPITLLTDFGQADPYVGIMKGVILGILPQACIIDLCHDLPSYDIEEAAFLIQAAHPYFPPGSIHVVVVDPGVGGPRRPLLVTTERCFFIAPDNGVLSYIFERGGFRRAFEIAATHYFLSPQSSTFHGRDIFAPVAAYLSKGIEVESFGPQIHDPVRIPLSLPQWKGEGTLSGKVAHIDRFGNLITNIGQQDLIRLDPKGSWSQATVKMEGIEIKGVKSFYGQGERGKLEAIVGSTDHLEIFVNQGNASLISGRKKGDEVVVTLS